MTKEDIITGLNNAMARGESLAKAMSSMVASGYSVQEVQEAASSIDMGVIGQINEQQPEDNTQNMQEESQEVAQENVEQEQQVETSSEQNEQITTENAEQQIIQPVQQEQPKSRKKFWIIFIIILLIVVGIGAGIMLFYQQILDLFFK